MKKHIFFSLAFVFIFTTHKTYCMNNKKITLEIPLSTIIKSINISSDLIKTVPDIVEAFKQSTQITENIKAASPHLEVISDNIRITSENMRLWTTQSTIGIAGLILMIIGIYRLTKEDAHKKSKKQRWGDIVLTGTGTTLLISSGGLARIINNC